MKPSKCTLTCALFNIVQVEFWLRIRGFNADFVACLADSQPGNNPHCGWRGTSSRRRVLSSGSLATVPAIPGQISSLSLHP